MPIVIVPQHIQLALSNASLKFFLINISFGERRYFYRLISGCSPTKARTKLDGVGELSWQRMGQNY
jgi:hypothetical protein